MPLGIVMRSAGKAACVMVPYRATSLSNAQLRAAYPAPSGDGQ